MKINRQDLFVLLALAIITHVFYWKTWQAGFISDFTGLMSRLEGSSIAGVLDSFGFPSLSQVLNFFLFSIYKIFGIAPLPWYLIHTSLHILNAFLLYKIWMYLLAKWEISNANILAMLMALGFLLFPFQSEAVVWKVCLNFLLSGLWAMLILWNLFQFLEHQKAKNLYLLQGFFLLSLFTFELSLMLPFIILIIVFIWHQKFPKQLSFKERGLIHIPQFGMVGIYFLLNKWILGTWVGHYGENIHLKFDLSSILATLFKYLSKSTFFVRYFPHTQKENFFNAFNQTWLHGGLFLIGIAMVVFYLLRFRKLSTKLQLGFLFLFLSLIALVPVLNLYFNYLLYIENDRYTYFFSLFFIPGLFLLMLSLQKQIGYVLMVIFLVTSTYLLNKTNNYWQESAIVQQNLMDDFKWYDHSEVYILAMPDNYKGIILYRDAANGNQGFVDALKYLRGKTYNGQMNEIAKFNMNEVNEGVTPTITSDSTIQVKFNHWGSWWWRKGRGALNYELDNYRFEKKDLEYQLTLKKIAPDAVFLYQDSLKFQELPFDPK